MVEDPNHEMRVAVALLSGILFADQVKVVIYIFIAFAEQLF